MIELSLMTLLNTMAPRYCVHKASGLNDTKSTLIAYSEMHDLYDSSEIRRVIRDGVAMEQMAVAMIATTCPLDAIRDND